jgi:hypothetical protein
MGFFRKALKFASPASYLPKSIRDVVYPVIGSVAYGAPGAAFASGLNNYIQGGDLKSSIINAGATYAGSQIGGSYLGDKLGTVGSTLSNVLGPELGSTAGNAIGSTLANTTLGSIAGAKVGSDIASSYAPAKNASRDNTALAAPVFKPSQQAEKETPFSIQGLGSLTANQQSSNIANQGVYGRGNGPEENSYFLNLLNRRLVDETGKVDSDLSEINPIETSYLKQLGIGGYSNPTSLLQAIQGWRPN